MTAHPVVVSTAEVPLDDVQRVAAGTPVELDAAAMERVIAARHVVEVTFNSDQHIYGLNSGLGHGKDERLSRADLAQYGMQTLDAHAAGVGPALSDYDVRALLFARLVGMTRGGAGVHPGAVRVLAAMLNAGVHPVVPQIGSVGASDLMHLAAIAQVTIGRGKARLNGTVMSGAAALQQAGIGPHVLAPQDALSLISGNSTSIGLGALTVLAGERIAALADVTGILTLEAVGGSIDQFDAEVAAAKPFAGQMAAAEHLRALLDGSDLRDLTRTTVQDPISLRVMPQVHGALREQLRVTRTSVQVELNAMDDNPLVSVERRRMIPNGNFHPLVLALAFESLRVGLAHVGMIAERRMNKVVSFSFGTGILWPPSSGWSPGRYAEEGVLAYSAAAVLAQLKTLAVPATLSCPPLDFDIEDHATLAPSAVLAAREAIEHLETILAIEALLSVDKLASLPERRMGRAVDPLYHAIRRILSTQAGETTPAEIVEQVRAVLRESAA